MLETDVSAQEVEAELRGVCHSATFERSERLQQFLRYVCDLTLKGEGSRINEYLIATEVFHRGGSYSPGEDSIVRRQAHALRHKLHDYYEKEGKGSAVRVDLPVGRYVPVFRRREETAAPVEPVATKPGIEPLPRTGRSFFRAASVAVLSASIAAAAMAFAAGWWLARRFAVGPERSALSSLPPAVREIWGPWFSDPAGAVICLSNPMTAVVKHFDKPVPPDSMPSRLRLNPGEEKMFRQVFSLAAGGYLYLTPALSQGKMGEALAAVSLSSLFSRAGTPVRATQSRFLSWEELRSRSFILMGHNEANRWLDPLLEKYPLRLAATSGEWPRRIINAQPRPGEAVEYRIEYSTRENVPTQEYALVSMIPGVDERHRLLLINGLNTQATQGAAEYLLGGATLEELVTRLRQAAPAHKGEWHFQAVLRTEVRDKVPTHASLVILRIL